jgi:hypothetical protein
LAHGPGKIATRQEAGKDSRVFAVDGPKLLRARPMFD